MNTKHEVASIIHRMIQPHLSAHLGHFQVRRRFGQRLGEGRHFFCAVEHSGDGAPNARQPIHGYTACHASLATTTAASGSNVAAAAAAARGRGGTAAAVRIGALAPSKRLLVQRARVGDGVFCVVERLFLRRHAISEVGHHPRRRRQRRRAGQLRPRRRQWPFQRRASFGSGIGECRNIH